MASNCAPLPVWPHPRLGEALAALAQASGLVPAGDSVRALPARATSRDSIAAWISSAADRLGFEAEPLRLEPCELERRLQHAAPAIVVLPDGGILAALTADRFLTPGHGLQQVPPHEVQMALWPELVATARGEAERMLEIVGSSGAGRKRAVDAIVRSRLRDSRPDGASLGAWSLRASPGGSFWRHAARAGLRRRLAVLAALQIVEFALWIVTWGVIGSGALEGRFDRGWLTAWVILLITLVPFRAATLWLQGTIAVTAAGLLKERLLLGALRLDPDEIRGEGAGRLLARAIDSDALESVGSSGGFESLAAGTELILAMIVLAAGAGGPAHAGLLAVWTGVSALMGWRYFRGVERLAATRLRMTHDLVERLAGQRTRLAQEPADRWHDAEDRGVAQYLDSSIVADRREAALVTLVPRGWLMLGVAGLTPAFVSGSATPAALAVGLGGMLLAFRALHTLTIGFGSIAAAVTSWRQAALLFQAASRPVSSGEPSAIVDVRDEQCQRLIDARDLTFSYKTGAPVLRGCSLRVDRGEHVLLEGPSGAGKSTLTALLCGLRIQSSGFLLLGGLDRHALGATGWRLMSASAPQFHENHVLTGTFAFNLLMGCRGLIDDRSLDDARAVCLELGLGPLLDRMPAGLMQPVGEGGWQLSHGERSRLFVARALLQDAELVVLDESFAALDPHNVQRVVDCAIKRARTLVAISHR